MSRHEIVGRNSQPKSSKIAEQAIFVIFLSVTTLVGLLFLAASWGWLRALGR